MKDECLICKAPLVYLEADEEMECAICRKKENSKTRCENGHYVCNECHMHGPEHHVMVGAALLTAYKNAGGAIDFSDFTRHPILEPSFLYGGYPCEDLRHKFLLA